jgi:hypothetical protein
LKRFEALVERLSSQFEDVYADQAALVVRLLGKSSMGQNDGARRAQGAEAPSKRTIKVGGSVNFLIKGKAHY